MEMLTLLCNWGHIHNMLCKGRLNKNNYFTQLLTINAPICLNNHEKDQRVLFVTLIVHISIMCGVTYLT